MAGGEGKEAGQLLDAPPPITAADLVEAVAATKPSVHKKDAARYERWEQESSSNIKNNNDNDNNHNGD